MSSPDSRVALSSANDTNTHKHTHTELQPFSNSRLICGQNLFANVVNEAKHWKSYGLFMCCQILNKNIYASHNICTFNMYIYWCKRPNKLKIIQWTRTHKYEWKVRIDECLRVCVCSAYSQVHIGTLNIEQGLYAKQCIAIVSHLHTIFGDVVSHFECTSIDD